MSDSQASLSTNCVNFTLGSLAAIYPNYNCDPNIEQVEEAHRTLGRRFPVSLPLGYDDTTSPSIKESGRDG